MAKSNEILTAVLAAIGAIVLVVGLGFLFAFPLMLITNALFSTRFLTFVFGIAQLTFWKAYWLGVFLSWTIKSTTTSSK